MGRVSGSELKIAAKKAATWGTAVACGAGDGFLFLPTSIKKDFGVDIDDSLGAFFSMDGTTGDVKVEGDLPLYARYDGMDVLLAMVMGTAGVPTLHAGGAASYDYTYKPAKYLDGLFVTIAKHMKNYIEEVPSVKIAGFTLKGESGKPLQIIFKVIGIDKVTNSTINTAATFNNVTIADASNRIRFADGVFRMNDASGTALAAGDKIFPNSFELSFMRKMSGIATGQYQTSGSSKQNLIDEPTADGLPEIRLKLTFPQHTGNTYLLALGNDTRKKMDITFTGATIEGAIPRLFGLQFPHLQLLSDDITDEQGIIKEPLEFAVHGCIAAPAGMTGITDPFWITGTNKRSGNPLA